MQNARQWDGSALLGQLRAWARNAGFSQIGVADVDLNAAEPGLLAWLHNGFQGEMAYMAAHGLKRARPAELVPGTVRVITARMDYLPRDTPHDWQVREWQRLQAPQQATVSVYARGRDYHKILRTRLQGLAERLAQEVGPFGHRVFTDSAPVLEVELAARSGIGWRGKHTLALTEAVGEHCGTCSACIDICPTQAILGPQRLDARRCISYLTIEHAGAIPVELRAPLGNRIYGCDDCQLVCPWNKFAQRSALADFDVRGPLGDATLLALWAWDEAEFLQRTEGSAIRRIGHARWQRNIAVALGNALRAAADADIVAALQARRESASALLREHIDWALAQRRA
jgi:epoxyqueuosine reductase